MHDGNKWLRKGGDVGAPLSTGISGKIKIISLNRSQVNGLQVPRENHQRVNINNKIITTCNEK